jgi:hypothetical protein
VLAQALVLAVVETIASLLLGRLAQARDVSAAWTANLRDRRDIRERRKALKAVRVVRDREVKMLQVRGSARVAAFFRGQMGANDDRLASMSGAGRGLADTLRSSTARASIVAWVLVLVLLAFGSRDLLTAPIPAVGDFVAFPSGPADLLREWVSGYHAAGLGSDASNPTALGLVGTLGFVFLGAMGQLRRVLILGLLPLGALGMWRLARPIGSRRSRIVALVVYAAMPVAANSFAAGRWSGLVIYALAPWLMNQLARASRLAPFGSVGDERGPGVVDRPLTQRILLLGLITTIGATVVPYTVPIMIGIALAMAVGGILVGQLRGAVRLVGVALAAAVVAVVLQLPWGLEFLHPTWASLVGSASLPAPDLRIDEILRFATGPAGQSALTWAFLGAASLALLIGRRWRLAWAMRGWAVAIAGWALVFLAAQGKLTGKLPPPEVLLAPAAAGLALAAAMGMAAFEVDLPDYHFGWRQIASLLAGAALVVALVPFLETSTDGSWNMPRGDFNQLLSNLESPSDSFRMLWLGDESVVPLTGWPLDAPGVQIDPHAGRLVYATTTGRTPTVSDLWPGPDDGATTQLHDVLRAAADGESVRLGSMLAPMGIEYLVVPQATSTLPGARPGPPTPALLDMLGSQLDLARVPLPSGITVYRNTAWGPATARLPRGAAIPAGGSAVTAAPVPGLTGAPDAVPNRSGFASASGVLPGPALVYVASASSDRWVLQVNGTSQTRGDAFGWANQYPVDATGQVNLHYQTSKLRYLFLALEVLLWALVIWYLWHTRIVKEAELDLAHVREDHEL